MSGASFDPTRVPQSVSPVDPAPLFELFRGNYATELLVAATAHLGVFRVLREGPLDARELGSRIGLEARPMQVLETALRAMGTLRRRDDGRLEATELSRWHLDSTGSHYVGDYFALAASTPGVLAMVERLRSNRPAGADEGGVGFIYREGMKSAMEAEEGARFFTLALAGRAKNVAPALAKAVSLEGVKRLVDVGGGTGVYAIALLRANPTLEAVVWDRPEVLRVAAEFAAGSGVSDRLQHCAGDMFRDPFPEGADAVLLSNILHDWDRGECVALLKRCHAALPVGGRVLIHDVFLDDDLGGPLPVALYSAALFSVTEGRAYSAGEYGEMLVEAGFEWEGPTATRVHCGVLIGRAASGCV